MARVGAGMGRSLILSGRLMMRWTLGGASAACRVRPAESGGALVGGIAGAGIEPATFGS